MGEESEAFQEEFHPCFILANNHIKRLIQEDKDRIEQLIQEDVLEQRPFLTGAVLFARTAKVLLPLRLKGFFGSTLADSSKLRTIRIGRESLYEDGPRLKETLLQKIDYIKGSKYKNASTAFGSSRDGLPDWSCFDSVANRKESEWTSLERRGQQNKLKKERDKGGWKFHYIFCLTICILTIFNNLVGGALASQDPGRLKTQDLVWTVNRLSSPACSLDIQIKAGKCPESVAKLNIALALCNFSCPPHEEPFCQNTDVGPAYFCSPKNRVCEAGIRRRVQVDRTNPYVLKIIQEICPQSTYQPVQSACYGACQYLHQISFPDQDQFLVKSEGDNVSPSVWYCNYKKGYYNKNGTSFVREDSPLLTDFCTNVKNNNPCADEEHSFPLPNGTCVEACPKNYYRDDTDGFTCKPKSGTAYDQPTSVASVSSTEIEFGEIRASTDVVLTAIKLKTTTTKEHLPETSSGKKTTTTSEPNDFHHKHDATVRVGVFILVAAVGVTIIGGGIFIGVRVAGRRGKLRRLRNSNPELGSISIREPGTKVFVHFPRSSDRREFDSSQRNRMMPGQGSRTDLKIQDEAQPGLQYVSMSETDTEEGAALRIGKTETFNDDADDRNGGDGNVGQALL